MASVGRKGWVGVDRHWLEDPRLSSTDVHLMMWLDSHDPAYLDRLHVKAVAEQLGWTRRRVTSALDVLEKLGLISREKVPHPGSGERTKITLYQSAWSDRASRQHTTVSQNDTSSVSQNDSPTTSTHSGEESSRGAVVVDDLAAPTETWDTAKDLCVTLADLIEADGAKRPNVSERWVQDMDRLIRLDDRDPDTVLLVLRWLTAGRDDVASFWWPNIRSPGKLREKWDQMAAQYRARTKSKMDDVDVYLAELTGDSRTPQQKAAEADDYLNGRIL